MSLVDFTVAIPTYNGEHRLPKVLEKLRSQVGTELFCWEVLIVDNNSSDDTAKIVQRYQQNWLPNVPLTYCFESRQGQSFARQKAVQNAKGDLIAFVDDDNFLAPDWVAAAYKFGQSHPHVGAYSGRIIGIFETPPPPNFSRIATFLALRDRGSKAKPYDASKKMVPPSAGLVVRTTVWLNHVPETLKLVGRVGNTLVGGEDVEALTYIQQAGWEIWYNPEMLMEHDIPGSRLERDYLMKLGLGIGLSSYPVRMIKFSTWQRPFALAAYALNDLRRIALHTIKHKADVQTDVVAACEMQFHIGRLISPLFFWRNALRSWFG